MTKERDDYAKLRKILTLINLLRNTRRGLTYEEISEEFEWSRKTTERTLKLLKEHFEFGFTEERDEDRKKYFRLKAEDSFPPGYISENEIVALKTAIGFVKMNDPLKLPLESLAAKLEAMKKGGASNIEDLALINGTASAPRPRIQINRKIVETLQEATLTYHVIKIDYEQSSNGVVTPLVLRPLGFLYGVQNNYLVAAYKGEAEWPRHYILNQILSVEMTNESFDAKGFDIHEYAKKSFGAWISHDGGYKVKWRVKPEAVERAKRFVFHPTQKMTQQKDGSLIVEFVADGLKEMAWHLMTWEGEIQPIAPKELIDEYKNQLTLAAEALK